AFSAALYGCIQMDDRAARTDVRVSDEPRDPLGSGDCFGNSKLIDPEMADSNIEAWEDRPLPCRRPKFGNAMKNDQIGMRIVDRQAVREPGRRMPFYLDQRRFYKQSVGIVQANVAKAGVAPD